MQRRALDMLSRWKGMETSQALSVELSHYPTLDMLSRLKGMETLLPRQRHTLGRLLWICFPVGREWKLSYQGTFHKLDCPLDMLSRLKGMETQLFYDVRLLLDTLDMLSRLKGMETIWSNSILNSKKLWICFPV